MCELLGMSATCPMDLASSLEPFREHGGRIGPHADGWGVALYDGAAARIVKEPVPAARSRLLHLLRQQRLESPTIVAHIRRANLPSPREREALGDAVAREGFGSGTAETPHPGGRRYANTHPFEREVSGRSWVFAHNGRLNGLFAERTRLARPTGETDSEHAFCLLLDELAGEVDQAGRVPDPVRFLDRLAPAVTRLTRLGRFNFLLTNGELLVAHAHDRLHALQRQCRRHGCEQLVWLVATEPLTDEPWRRLEPGTLLAVSGARVLAERGTEPGVALYP